MPTGGNDQPASSDGGSISSTRSTEQAAPTDTASEPSVAAKRAPSSGGGSAGDSASPSTPAISPPTSPPIAPLPTPARPTRARIAAATAPSSVRPSSCWRLPRARSIARPPRSCKVTDDLGGYVVSSSVSSNSSGQFELRVPERRLQTALSRLSRVAKVRERTQNAQDITGAVVSVSGRLKEARTERRSLLRQLAKATTPNETASIRARLRLVSGEIAGYKRDLSRVKSRATRSTIAVTLLADHKAAAGHDGSGWTPGDALDDATRILEVTAGVLLVAFALLLPLGLVGLLVWLAARQAAQRRRERALDAV